MSVSDLRKLPDLALGTIFSHLHWTDKIVLTCAIPALKHILHSPLGWSWFVFRDQFASSCQRTVLKMSESECIRRYGHLFQHMTVYLGERRFQRSVQFLALDVIGKRCTNLKSLRIVHNEDTFFACDAELLEAFSRKLDVICRQDSLQRLELLNVIYLAKDLQRGLEEALEVFLHRGEEKVTSKLVALDFSLNVLPTPLLPLCSFSRLKYLKAPIHCFNTYILQTLASGELSELYLINSFRSVEAEFSEAESISWTEVAEAVAVHPSRHLNVHYVFCSRKVDAGDLCPNPLARSVILESTSDSVSSALLEEMANLYWKTLRTFAYFGSLWAIDSPFADSNDLKTVFASFTRKCSELRTFASSVSLVEEVYLIVASSSVKAIYCIEDEVEMHWGKCKKGKNALLKFEAAMSARLGFQWRTLSRREMDEKVKELTSFHSYSSAKEGPAPVGMPYWPMN